MGDRRDRCHNTHSFAGSQVHTPRTNSSALPLRSSGPLRSNRCQGSPGKASATWSTLSRAFGQLTEPNFGTGDAPERSLELGPRDPPSKVPFESIGTWGEFFSLLEVQDFPQEAPRSQNLLGPQKAGSRCSMFRRQVTITRFEVHFSAKRGARDLV